jgi:hypothetical protein
MSTTIYLDVDGVLNAVSKRTPAATASGWDEWKTKNVNGFQIQFSHDMVSAINELASNPDVTFKWLTTWEEDAANVLSPAIGINGQEWEVLSGDQHAWHGRDWWKLQAIQNDVLSTTPDRFVWIDDDISAEREAINWSEGRDNGLWISPDARLGLTSAALAKVVSFAAERVRA